MKKLLAILAFATIGFVACNDNSDDSTTTDTTNVVTQDTTQVVTDTTIHTDTINNN